MGHATLPYRSHSFGLRPARRRAQDGSPAFRHAGLGILVLATLTCGAAALAGISRSMEAETILRLAESLRVVSALLFFGTGVLYVSAWRIISDPRSTLVGGGLIVFGSLTLPLRSVAGLLHTSEPSLSLSPVTRTLVTLAALSLIVAALRAPKATNRSRACVLTLAALCLTVTGFIGLVVAHNALGIDLDPAPPLHVALELSMAAAWFGTAAAVATSTRQVQASSARRGACLLALLGVVSMLRAAAVLDLTTWGLAAAVLSVTASGIVLASVWVRAEQAASSHQRRRDEVTHDARNAIAALRAASTALSRYGETFDASTRQQLRTAMLGEIGHLEHLISRPAHVTTVDFDLGQVIGPIAAAQRADGLEVDLGLHSLWARGVPGDLAAVVQNLLVNVRRHAGGSAVTISARSHGSVVQICVEDRGPGLTALDGDASFDRGVTGDASTGSGLGLHIARTLMHDQGGDIELRACPGGGASFVLTLPRTQRATAGMLT